MATRLQLYKIALAALGERTIAILSEDREPRRLLDEVWNRGSGAVRYMLEQGLWDFGMRVVSIDNSASVSPGFGFTYAFDKPTDMVRLAGISIDAEFADPLLRYEFQSGFIVGDTTPIYLRYVSDDASYGGDLSLWPETFTLWAGHWMATQISPALKNDVDMSALKDTMHEQLISARLKDASQAPRPWPPAKLGDFDHRQLDSALEFLLVTQRKKQER